jgi:hypothetical protein
MTAAFWIFAIVYVALQLLLWRRWQIGDRRQLLVDIFGRQGTSAGRAFYRLDPANPREARLAARMVARGELVWHVHGVSVRLPDRRCVTCGADLGKPHGFNCPGRGPVSAPSARRAT